VPELSAAYHATRKRITAMAEDLDEASTARKVPACPDWTVHDLLAHVSGIPDALTSGDGPSGDLQGWLDGLVDARREVPVAELLRRWAACADATSDLVDGGAGLLAIDVVMHEHDLRGALGQPGARGAAELRAIVQPALELLVPAMKAAGLGSLVIDADGVRWASHVARPGCTLHVDPWEAARAIGSRRTAAELRALPASGDVEPYLAVIDAHLPLPAASLGEA
jgi:uncharacterized protein (TIGR03083 family)